MKNVLIAVSFFALMGQAYAQSEYTVSQPKPLNNPLYSTHNYKHPNAAAAARRWESKEGLSVKKPTPAETQLANYKSQMPIAQPSGSITLPHTPSVSLADRNYKIQRGSQSTVSPSEYYVKKQSRKGGSTTVGE